MSAIKYFLFQSKTELWIVKNPDKVPKPRELLMQNSNIEYLRAYAQKLPKITQIHDKVTRQRHKHFTEEGLRKQSTDKIGAKNPNHGGLSEEHKAKISRTMRGTRRGYMNPMHGRRHSVETKRKMGMAQRRRVRKWCVEPSGKTHLVDVGSFVLPAGWMWGRKYDPYRQ